jgi:membrane-associated protease RseP (regulator of RpoE activity)
MFLLLLLGLITYFIVQRVTTITRTPAWLLWLVVMTPALILTVWRLVYGENKPIPLLLVVGPFVICLFLYWFLIQWGRIPTPPANQTNGSATPSAEGTPTPAQPEPAVVRPIDKAEESQLQSCFPWSIYYLQNIEYRPQAVICRGQLRTNPDTAYATVSENVQTHFGDRFLLVFQEGLNNKPFFVLVPNPQAQQAEKQVLDVTTRPALALFLFAATLMTTVMGGVQLTGKEFQPQLSSLLEGLPYALSLIAILGLHKLSQYFVARFHQVRVTLPYFLPVFPVPFFPFGTFGAFIHMRSPVPSRKALFDIGLIGPLTGFVVTLPVLIWGLMQSSLVPIKPDAGMLEFKALNPSFSFLLATLSKLIWGSQLTPEKALNLHPVAIAGYLGLIVLAFHLMPVGQLDGGRMIHAMFGQRAGAMIGQVARLLLLGLFLAQSDRLILLWAVILFLVPVVDEPALNDVSELDNRRDFLGLVMLGLLLLIVLPAPRSLVSFFNF